MPNTASFLLALSSGRDFQIIDELVGIAETFDCILDVVAKLLIELDIANTDHLWTLASVDNVIFGYLLQHGHVTAHEVVDRRFFDVVVIVGADKKENSIRDIFIREFVAIFLTVVTLSAEK
jgi:hypothetical protein